MERRIHKRIYINEKAKIIMDNRTYNGYIVNVSERGISYMITSSFPVKDEIAYNTVIELVFQTPSGKTQNLNCEVIWTKKGLYTGKTIALGMKIIDPSSEYQVWIKELLISNSCDKTDQSSISSSGQQS